MACAAIYDSADILAGADALCCLCSIPFFVAAPTTTLDPNLPAGSGITIEHRPGSEVTHFQGKQVAPDGIDVSSTHHCHCKTC